MKEKTGRVYRGRQRLASLLRPSVLSGSSCFTLFRVCFRGLLHMFALSFFFRFCSFFALFHSLSLVFFCLFHSLFHSLFLSLGDRMPASMSSTTCIRTASTTHALTSTRLIRPQSCSSRRRNWSRSAPLRIQGLWPHRLAVATDGFG